MLLSEHSKRNSYFQHRFGLFLYALGASRQLISICNHLGYSVSYPTIVGTGVQSWQGELPNDRDVLADTENKSAQDDQWKYEAEPEPAHAKDNAHPNDRDVFADTEDESTETNHQEHEIEFAPARAKDNVRPNDEDVLADTKSPNDRDVLTDTENKSTQTNLNLEIEPGHVHATDNAPARNNVRSNNRDVLADTENESAQANHEIEPTRADLKDTVALSA